MTNEIKSIKRVYTGCPRCQTPHVDTGEWATKPHKEHLCESCGAKWTPVKGKYTVGIEHLNLRGMLMFYVQKDMDERASPRQRPLLDYERRAYYDGYIAAQQNETRDAPYEISLAELQIPGYLEAQRIASLCWYIGYDDLREAAQRRAWLRYMNEAEMEAA